jgi:hypothetical protein
MPKTKQNHPEKKNEKRKKKKKLPRNTHHQKTLDIKNQTSNQIAKNPTKKNEKAFNF